MDDAVSAAAPLMREARFLHQHFFGRGASAQFVDAYCRAHSDLPELQAFKAVELATVRTIVERDLDALAIEPWLRRPGRRHPLSAKLLLVAYLAEADASHAEFSRGTPSVRCTLCRFVTVCIAAGTQLLWGRVLRARHGLI
ncbi:MAG: hypothetical protein QM777_26010 [Pseudorhodoferax sp.]